jgi:D-alanyl-D-alanine carboxypeptidase
MPAHLMNQPPGRSGVRALGTGQLLKPATFAQQKQYVDVPGSTAKYGLGIFNFDGYLGHNGSLPGYTSFVAR